MGYMLPKAIEKMGEAGLAARSAPQIEATSILGLGNAEAHWRTVCVQWLNNMYVYMYFATRAVWSACK